MIRIVIDMYRGRNGSVGIATGWMIGARFPEGARDFLFSTLPRPKLGSTQPPIQWIPVDISLEVKRTGRETDHSPSSCAEVKNVETIPPFARPSSWCGA
jgi:hypothetical protein